MTSVLWEEEAGPPGVPQLAGRGGSAGPLRAARLAREEAPASPRAPQSTEEEDLVPFPSSPSTRISSWVRKSCWCWAGAWGRGPVIL